MTRIDKIIAIKKYTDIAGRINLYTCNEGDIDKLYAITSQQDKGLPRSIDGYQVINQIEESQKRKKSIGKFSSR